MAVVAAFEFDDFVTASKAARQANGAHGRFGTGVHHTHHVHGWHQFSNQLRHSDFHLGRRTEAQATLGRFNHRITNSRVVMAQYHRPPGTDIVDIGFAIHVVQIRAVRTLDKQRRTAHAGEGTYRRVHPAWDKFTRSAIQVFRFAHCQDPGSWKMFCPLF